MSRLVGIVLLSIATASCTSGSHESGPGNHTPSNPGQTATSQHTPVSTPPAQVQLSETDMGHPLRVHIGDLVALTLHSTDWSIPTLRDHILTVDGAPAYTPAKPGACPPGAGCGTVTVSFTAQTVGTTVLQAHRTSCGEALACKPAQRDLIIVVTVTPTGN